MNTLLAMTTIITVLLIVIMIKLLLKIRIINKKIKYVDEANMWHKLAVTDDLTGIYNRNAYNLYVNKTEIDIQKESRWIILFDVDDFKTINDTEGHLAGDVVLKNVAKILLEVFSDFQYKVFRIGGDEFLVLAEGVSENEIIEQLLALKKRLATDGNISLSKGYSIIKNNSEKAFKYADEMLYADKLSKKLRNSSSKNI
ncbi:MAG: GGDEF domain-containing protein [Clostridia bacterium]|nr:GGDEF domain-containing protein [Clostridia bacterium]